MLRFNQPLFPEHANLLIDCSEVIFLPLQGVLLGASLVGAFEVESVFRELTDDLLVLIIRLSSHVDVRIFLQLTHQLNYKFHIKN